MTEQEKKALHDLFITQSPFTDTGFDAFSLTELLGRTSADDIFDVIKNISEGIKPPLRKFVKKDGVIC